MRPLALAAALALLAPALAHAATLRLDDSASQVSPPVADWQWLPPVRGSNTRLEMDITVRVRIDTRALDGRAGRVYMSFAPEAGASGVTATWQTQGKLLGGKLAAGERALVYEGRLAAPWLEDVMRVRLATDSRFTTAATRRLEFRFELDTP